MVAQLDTKTVYTFMDSLISIKKYVETAKNLGYQTLGIMDIDNLYGVYHFMETATEQGIQPLLGVEMTLDYAGLPLNLRFLALDSQGYRNLMKLSTLKMIGKSKWEEFQHLLEGIAAIVPVFEGIEALDLGQEFYIGVFPDTPKQAFPHATLPLQTVRYFDTGDLETLQMLCAIRENSSLREVGNLPNHEYFLSPEQFTQSFQENYPESLDNLKQLVAGIHYEINTELKLPRFNPERPAVEELQDRAEAGLEKKRLNSPRYHLSIVFSLSVQPTLL